MTTLTIQPEDGAAPDAVHTDFPVIAKHLSEVGILLERWEAARPLAARAGQHAVLAAYAEPVDRLKALYGFKSADVISVGPEHQTKSELRATFLKEHTHSDHEVRFFVEGRGLFYLHPDARVFTVLCERGDLISIPAGMRHWFDLGAEPDLKCIRLFTSPEGWKADYTGSDIATRFPTLEAFLAEHGGARSASAGA
jgi:1,2-dihydroxy-3-keto-5-methylthiopentene dioxygenase